MSWAGIAAGGAGLVGGLLQNEQSRREAAENRKFQEQMSSTSHQRQVKDLKAAGLNPLLSATGGASTPTGAQAPIENIVSGAAASALDAERVGLTSKMNQAQLQNLDSQNKLLKAQANKTAMETHVLSKDVPKADVVNMVWDKAKGFINKIGEEQKASTPKGSFDIQKHPFHEKAKKHNIERQKKLNREWKY